MSTTDQYLSTPGEILKEEFMEPYGISNYRLAKALGISETAVGQIVNGKRAITVRTAFMLSRAFGTSPEFWLRCGADREWQTRHHRAYGVHAVSGLRHVAGVLAESATRLRCVAIRCTQRSTCPQPCWGPATREP